MQYKRKLIQFKNMKKSSMGGCKESKYVFMWKEKMRSSRDALQNLCEKEQILALFEKKNPVYTPIKDRS